MDPQEMEQEVFWMHVTGLPRFCYTKEAGQKISKLFQIYKEFQIHEEQTIGFRFFRIRALVQINKPLQRCVRICTPDGTIHTGIIKYERLPLFCFLCGHIGHRYRLCPQSSKDTNEISALEYGSWMGGVDGLKSQFIFSSLDNFGTAEQEEENTKAATTKGKEVHTSFVPTNKTKDKMQVSLTLMNLEDNLEEVRSKARKRNRLSIPSEKELVSQISEASVEAARQPRRRQ